MCIYIWIVIFISIFIYESIFERDIWAHRWPRCLAPLEPIHSQLVESAFFSRRWQVRRHGHLLDYVHLYGYDSRPQVLNGSQKLISEKTNDHNLNHNCFNRGWIKMMLQKCKKPSRPPFLRGETRPGLAMIQNLRFLGVETSVYDLVDLGLVTDFF